MSSPSSSLSGSGATSKKYRDTSPSERPGSHDGPSSAADAGESLMGHAEKRRRWTEDEEESPGGRRRTAWRDTVEAFERCRWIIDVILLLFIIGLLMERRAKSYGFCEYEGNGDITGFAPKIAQQIKTFVPDFGFAPENASEFFTDAVQQKWLDMVPRGLGYVKVDEPSQYNNLPRPLLDYNGTTVFTSSVTHQLHCLHSIVNAFSANAVGDDSKLPEGHGWHLNHCFEYLRQNILCCGDTALEGEATTFPPGETGSDGWDAKHVCKNYDQVKAYLDENRADDELWI
ncbi:hypothetical protein RB594_006208 [Gaeumannomyces avenae]